MKIAHILNPVNVAAETELGIAQPITFESIRRAIDFSRKLTSVSVYAVGYPEDVSVIPAWVERLPYLQRSVLDFADFKTKRKYPLLADVWNALYASTDADFLIFSNMDIGLLPQFYEAVSTLINEHGYDALMINRRGISRNYKTEKRLSLMYSEFGSSHPGFDCFVIHRDLLSKLVLEKICLGVSFSEVAMAHNLIAFAKNLRLVDDLHLTFHIGTEVMPPLNQEYYSYNRKEYEEKIYPEIKHLLVLEKFPYTALPFHKRMVKWMINPNFRTHQLVELEGKSLFRRLKYRIDQWRFALLDRLR